MLAIRVYEWVAASARVSMAPVPWAPLPTRFRRLGWASRVLSGVNKKMREWSLIERPPTKSESASKSNSTLKTPRSALPSRRRG